VKFNSLLGNIVEINHKPVVFDAIEFDDDMATADVLYDLAFLIMDLDVRGYGRAANLLLNGYLRQSDSSLDLYGLQALPLFLAIRAAIRAMVVLQRGLHRDQAETEEARRYLDHALSYLKRREPRLIAVGGCSGTGKSTLARAIAPLLGGSPGAIHLNSDVERKRIAGVTEHHRLGGTGYTPEMTAQVHAQLHAKAARVLRSGYSVVVDATFLEPGQRADIAEVARGLGVPFVGLWLKVPLPVAQKRVWSRAIDVSDATPDVVERQFEAAMPPADWMVIEARGASEAVLAKVNLHVAGFQPVA